MMVGRRCSVRTVPERGPLTRVSSEAENHTLGVRFAPSSVPFVFHKASTTEVPVLDLPALMSPPCARPCSSPSSHRSAGPPTDPGLRERARPARFPAPTLYVTPRPRGLPDRPAAALHCPGWLTQHFARPTFLSPRRLRRQAIRRHAEGATGAQS